MKKIMIVGGFALAQNALSIAYGFQSLDWEVSYQPSRGRVREHIARDRKFMVDEARYIQPGEFILDCETEADFSDWIQQQVDTLAPDILLWWYARNDIPPGLVAKLRDKCATVFFTGDPLRAEKNPEYVDGFEFGATCCRESCEQLNALGVKARILYPPPCAEIHGIAEPNLAESCDVSFTPHALYSRQGWKGMLATRDEMVEAVRDLGKLHIYGGLGAGTFPGLQRQAYRGWREYEELPGVYAAAKINLNHHALPNRYAWLNVRDLAIPASGGFLLTDHVAGIEELFDLGREIDTWRTLDELKEKVAWWLAHDRERRQAAARGQERALREHGAQTFAQKLIELTGR